MFRSVVRFGLVNRRQTDRRVRFRAAILVAPAALLLGAVPASAQDATGLGGDLPLDTHILTRGEAAPPRPLPVPTSAGPAAGPIPFLEPADSAIPSLPGLPD